MLEGTPGLGSVCGDLLRVGDTTDGLDRYSRGFSLVSRVDPIT